jgi:hypothetical protein
MSKETSTIKIHMNSQSKPIVRKKVVNLYTKDGLYCVYLEDGTVKKYPLVNIFEIEESYN